MWRYNERGDRLGYTHGIETMSETTAYRNHIQNSEIETREVFERETSNLENSLLREIPDFKRLGHCPLRHWIYGTLSASELPERRTVTGSGGARTGMIRWGIRMILKL